jgi:hypothetical protein
MFNDKKWWMWSRDGKVIVNGNKIEERMSSISEETETKESNPFEVDSNQQNEGTGPQSYPSQKDGAYGAIIQLEQEPNLKFARLRGREVSDMLSHYSVDLNF